MNKKLYLTLLSATILTLSMIPQFSTSASSPPTIYLDPSDYTFTTDTVTLGYKFNVTIRVTDLEKLMMFQVYITFNDSIINVTQVDSYAKAWPNDLLGGRAWDPELRLLQQGRRHDRKPHLLPPRPRPRSSKNR